VAGADAVAKAAGLRAKQGPKKEARIKGTIRRGKANHSGQRVDFWRNSVENPTPEMAPPRGRNGNGDEKGSLSTAMELQIASS
jgi:hypothetical protein